MAYLTPASREQTVMSQANKLFTDPPSHLLVTTGCTRSILAESPWSSLLSLNSISHFHRDWDGRIEGRENLDASTHIPNFISKGPLLIFTWKSLSILFIQGWQSLWRALFSLLSAGISERQRWIRHLLLMTQISDHRSDKFFHLRKNHLPQRTITRQF